MVARIRPPIELSGTALSVLARIVTVAEMRRGEWLTWQDISPFCCPEIVLLIQQLAACGLLAGEGLIVQRMGTGEYRFGLPEEPPVNVKVLISE